MMNLQVNTYLLKLSAVVFVLLSSIILLSMMLSMHNELNFKILTYCNH